MAAAAVAAVLITACAPSARLGPIETSHPASAEAPEATVVEPSRVLRGGRVGDAAQEPAPEMPHGHGMMHGAHGMHGGGEKGAER